MQALILFAMMSLFSSTNEPPEKVYTKLEYAADTPYIHPQPSLSSVALAKEEAPQPSYLIYLDPGHGGDKNHGCRGHDGRYESEANLLLALDIRRHLEKSGVKVLMTREGDVDVPLYDRPREAHRIKAWAFVSVHHNAPGAGKDPLVTRYRAVYSWNDLGKKLADAIALELDPCQSLHANFAVTRSPEIPSVLIEADFLTHPEGCRDSFDPAKRDAIAAKIATAIVKYLGLEPRQ